MAMFIDTLALANKLKQAGMGKKQAEAITEAIASGLSVAGGDLVKKADLTGLASSFEARLTNRIYAAAVGQAVLTVAGIGVLPHLKM